MININKIVIDMNTYELSSVLSYSLILLSILNWLISMVPVYL